MKNVCILSFLFLISINSYSNIHWESIVLAENEWHYFAATSEPENGWMNLNFDDQDWSLGVGGIGYNDGDDQTIIDAVNSLYLRKRFYIAQKSLIENLVLDIDYDDAFVAYLNGVEIARSSNLSEASPTYNSPLTTDREAEMYQGGMPENYPIDTALLVNDENILAVQIINNGINSSDLSSLIFLNAQINSDTILYNEPPSWFVEPFNFTQSNLPIIVINTNNQNIKDDPKIIAHMGIIQNGPGQINRLSDSFGNYDGRISIEIRGESSQMFPKKSYLIETQDSLGANNNVPLLGMPKENDWILYAPYSDKSLLRNTLTFEMGHLSGEYCSRTKYFELVLNGSYKGLYVLMEKIKIDKGRVDIASMGPMDIIGDVLSGGYILRVDKRDEDFKIGYSGWTSDYRYSGSNGLEYQYYSPEPKELKDEQKNYITDYLSKFEKALGGANYRDPDLGYNKFIDVGSFINFMLVNEISKEVDKYRYSSYFYKERDSRGGKIFAGPLWDFNLGYANVDYWNEGLSTSAWLYNDIGGRIYWWQRLRQDPYYKNLVFTRWVKLRESDFSDENLIAKIDSMTGYIHEAQMRNFKQWPILDSYVWPNNYIGGTYENEVLFLKNWLLERLQWMDNNITGNQLNPIAIISQKGFEFANDVRIKITLVDDYFNCPVLKITDFMISGLPSNLNIERIEYINASEALVHFALNGYNIHDLNGVSISINKNILNGFESIKSNEIDLTETGIALLDRNSVKIYTRGKHLIIECDQAQQLPKQVVILNLMGQKTGSYPISNQTINDLYLPLSSNFYLVRLLVNNSPLIQKIRLGEE
ncbi:MAG: CotH kinase family protein [Prolixibacteraceae bacterium]